MAINNWWREPDLGGEREGCAASRMWRNACNTLVAPAADDAWQQIVEASPPDSVWHSLRNCVAYQAGVWHNLQLKGIADVMQPAAFKLAIVLRHTPSELTVRLLADLLHLHPQSQDLTAYVLALLTDDEAWCGSCGSSAGMQGASDDEASGESAGGGGTGDGGDGDVTGGDSVGADDAGGDADGAEAVGGEEAGGDGRGEGGDSTGGCPGVGGAGGGGRGDGTGGCGAGGCGGGAPLRDLQLFGDCELAVMAASREEYDAHAKLVRAEYANMTNNNYVELRIKVLNQFAAIPKLYHTEEFSCFEAAARENIEREICTLREHLLTGQHE